MDLQPQITELPSQEQDRDYEVTSGGHVCRRCWVTVSSVGDVRQRHLKWHARLEQLLAEVPR